MTGVRVDTMVTVDELGDFGGQGDIQTFDITNKRGVQLRIVNVYDQTLQKNNNRASTQPAREARWDEMITMGNVVVCGDFNAHSPWWNSG
jgi:endonuclease/exonuclease/phosphatase family metal-dependent hydrolase